MGRRLFRSTRSHCGSFDSVSRFVLPCVFLLFACLSSESAGSSANLCRGNAVSLLAGGTRGSLAAAYSDAVLQSDCLQPSLAGTENAVNTGEDVANTDGIFWSSAVEKLLPPRERSHRQRHWRQHSLSQAIGSIRKGCGRLRAAFTITFEDGRTQACARPLFDVDHLLGSLYGAALARLLGLGGHVPDLVLAEPPELDTERWRSAAAATGDRSLLQSWRQGQPVALVDLADDSRLGDAILPVELETPTSAIHSTQQSVTPHPLNPMAAARLSAAEAAVLAQWSDLVLFDYITAHSDRIINSLANARWGGGGGTSRRRPVHKMVVDTASGALLYADNEDALFQGHSLLASSADDSGRTYATYHELLLSRLCVFRTSTVAAIERHYRAGDLASRLIEAVERHDAVAERFLPYVSIASLNKMLQPRLANVLNWVRNCSATYGSTPLLPLTVQRSVLASDATMLPWYAGRS